MKDIKKIITDNISESEYEEMIRFMENNRGHGNDPKVGIFWWNEQLNELFGVVSHPTSDYSKPNCGGGKISCSELHEDVWKKQYYKQKFKKNGIGPFRGPYQDTPRGRIFYNINTDTYEICVGEWINKYPDAIDEIIDEFDLYNVKHTIEIKDHWNIGQTWN